MAAMIIVIFFAIGIHEYSHCKFADMAGDPTPRFYGRVTLNLFKHFEPIGTLMMVLSSLTGLGLGWGKPAPINPAKMANPRVDTFIAVAAGPVSNLVQAIIYGLFFRLALQSGNLNAFLIDGALTRSGTTFVAALLTLGVLLNLSLFAFNLIPFGPLDGHWLVGLLMPDPYRTRWFQFSRTYGWQILIAVILFSQIAHVPILSRIMFPVIAFFFKLITGVPIIG